MKKYKAIITDIDGTLTPIVPNAIPSKKVTESIQKSMCKGHIVSLASGRPFFLVKYLADHLGDIGPSIVDNGAVIADSSNGSILWEANLKTSHANKILELSSKFKLIRASCDVGALDNPKKLSPNTKVRKISVHDIAIQDADDLIDLVTNTFNDISAVKAASYEGNNFTDVYFSDALATKQHSVMKLAEILDISTDQIIGIGDGYNDFPLLMACGLKVAMENAVDDLKQIADEIAPSVENDGLAFIIDKYLS